jgi:DNA modification methylase
MTEQRIERIGDAILYQGDCYTILPTLPPVDAVVTDPPYGISYETSMDHRKNTDRGRGRSVAGDADTSARDAALAATVGTPALVFGSWKCPRPNGTKMVLTWEKGMNSGMGDLSLPWKPNTEEIYVLGKGFTGHRGSSVLSVQAPPSQISWGRVHPTEKPVRLMIDLITKCPGTTVLDPFMGSGSTGVACANLGRKFIGIEIDRQYFDIACERIRAAYAQGRLFPSRDERIKDDPTLWPIMIPSPGRLPKK